VPEYRFTTTNKDGTKYHLATDDRIYETDGEGRRLIVPRESVPEDVLRFFELKIQEQDDIEERRRWRSDWM